MTYANRKGIDPHFASLTERSNNIFASFDILQGVEPVDWHELKRLTDEVSDIGDQMEAMLPRLMSTA